MFSSPIDSTKQSQGVITPSIDGCAVTGGLTRRPNRGTLRSAISLAVRDSSTPQDLVLSKSSRLGNNYREVNPAAGSGNGIPPPSDRVCRQARRSFRSRRTTGNTGITRRQTPPGTDPLNDREPIPTKRLGTTCSDSSHSQRSSSYSWHWPVRRIRSRGLSAGEPPTADPASAGTRPVGPEAPDVSVCVARGELPGAVILIGKSHHDLGARSGRAVV